MTYSTQRPGGVTLLVVLGVIQGVLAVAGGLITILMRNNLSFADQVRANVRSVSSSDLVWFGIGAIVIGVIYLLVAKGLANGSGLSRILIAFVSALALAGGIWTALLYSGSVRWQAVVQAGIALI